MHEPESDRRSSAPWPSSAHIPVLYEEVLEFLGPRSGGLYIDCTVGSGGHAAGLLERSDPGGRLLGLDADPDALERARRRLEAFRGRFTLVHADFRELEPVASEAGFVNVQGMLFDLGLSSEQLEASGRGFSFQRAEEPLDMRLDPAQNMTAAELLNSGSQEELARVFREFGEEPGAARLVRAIVRQRRERPFQEVDDLLKTVRSGLGPRRGRLHPATKVFQALRIAVNDELDARREGLRAAFGLLAPGGRVAVVSFHSLEDRIVKHLFRECSVASARPRLQVLTPRPIVPGREEVQRNPRSRSAKLRVAQRV